MKLQTTKVAAAMRCSPMAISRELRMEGIPFSFTAGSRGQTIEIADDDLGKSERLSSLLPRPKPPKATSYVMPYVRRLAAVDALRAKLAKRPVARSAMIPGVGASRFSIFGEINSDTSREIADWLDSLLPGAAVYVALDSPGGEIFAGLSIYDSIRAWQGPTSCLIKNAASAASIVALAFDDRAIAENAFCLIHASHLEDQELSNSDESMLSKIDDRMRAIYSRHLSMTPSEIDAAMESELWLTATEAVAAGFASRILVS